MIYNKSENNITWDTKKLSELGSFDRGVSKYRPRNDSKLFEGGGYPFIQTSDIKDANLYIAKHTQEYGEFGLKQSKLWDAGTLCITIAANIADIAILSYPMCFPDSVVGFVADKKCCSEEFMYYIFSYINGAIKSIASGSTQDNINLEYLTTLEFKIPKKSYQDKIVKVLKSIDDKINLNNKINDNLSKQAELIIQNDLNKINKTCHFSNLINFINGYAFDSDNYSTDGQYKIITIKNVQDGMVNANNALCINDIPNDIDKNCKLYIGDILMSLTGNVGRVAIVNEKQLLLNQRVAKIEFKNDNKFWIYFYMRLPYFKLQLERISNGSAQKNLSPIETLKLSLKFDENIVSKSNKYLKHLFNQILYNQQENITLMQTRNYLLPLLINGQATIS